jgi:hypothetical protein
MQIKISNKTVDSDQTATLYKQSLFYAAVQVLVVIEREKQRQEVEFLKYAFSS